MTVALIVVAALILTLTNDFTGADTKTIFAFILGYVFKNGGVAAYNGSKAKKNCDQTKLIEG